MRVARARERRRAELPAEACAFAYRDSAFKREPDRHVVLAVTFALRPGGAPRLRYRELADALGRRGAAPTLADVRAAVLALRAQEVDVMIDAAIPNRRSVGSFFMNPIVAGGGGRRRGGAAPGATRAANAALAGRDGRVKLSAGWLIERAGIRPKGCAAARSASRPRTRSRWSTTAAARPPPCSSWRARSRRRCATRFGVTLGPEPIFVGLSWNPASG